MAPSKPLQESINDFWSKSLTAPHATTKMPKVLPESVYTNMISKKTPKEDAVGQSISVSYDEAVKECEAKVATIVAECKRTNTKYTDVHFNLDEMYTCLYPLSANTSSPESTGPPPDATITYQVTQTASSQGGPIYWGNVQPADPDEDKSYSPRPACAKRVGKIFKNPRFFVEGTKAKDVRQGYAGDCWFLCSLDSLCVDQQMSLIERLCPPKARDEKVGVYGFVFYRDGQWISEIVDDKLYLLAPDYDDCTDSRRTAWDVRTNARTDPSASREEYRKTFQTGSEALYYGSSSDPDETWVGLIEKAYAKTHGDYSIIEGGSPGEGIEDLTGGVTTLIYSDDILDEDVLWNEGFLKVGKEFLFSASSREYDNTNDSNRQGIQDNHAYSLLRAAQYKGERLVMVKNPWGRAEWDGAWSDGSKEWTADALQELGHTFGDDGIFWMPYKEFLQRYSYMWRTRLFTPDWNITQKWTTLQVPWSGDYIDTKFEFTLPEATCAIVILSQLDGRYFGGLKGQYSFELAFRLHKSNEETHIVRGRSSGERSASVELDLEAGTYDVFLQISGERDVDKPTVEQVVKENWLDRRSKLMRIGLSYDLANAKGREEEPEEPPKEKSEVSKEEGPIKAAANAVQSAIANVVQQAPTPPPETKEPAKTDTKETVNGETNGEKVAEKKEAVGTSDQAASEAAVKDVPNGVPTAGEAASAPVPVPDPQIPEPEPAPAAEPEETPETKPEDAPWDAICVVGLRLLCHKTSATIKVIKPKPADGSLTPAVKLDADDPEKDAAEKLAPAAKPDAVQPEKDGVEKLEPAVKPGTVESEKVSAEKSTSAS